MMRIKPSSRVKRSVFNFTLENDHCPKCNCVRGFQKERRLFRSTSMMCKKCRSTFEIDRHRDPNEFMSVPKEYKFLDPTKDSHNRQRRCVML